MTPEQLTAASRAVATVKDQLDSLNANVVAVDTGKATLQTSITSAVAALVALGASVAPPA